MQRRSAEVGQRCARSYGLADIWLESTKICTTDDSVGIGSEFRFYLPGSILETRPTEVIADTPVPPLDDPTIPTAKPVESDARRPSLDVLPSQHMRVFVVEDSSLIRRSIITKMQGIRSRLNAGAWEFHEHETVESILPCLEHFVHDENVIITVDQNLDVRQAVIVILRRSRRRKAASSRAATLSSRS